MEVGSALGSDFAEAHEAFDEGSQSLWFPIGGIEEFSEPPVIAGTNEEVRFGFPGCD